MKDGKEVKEIKCHNTSGLFGTEWTCHIYTKDGTHYQGKGHTEDKAKQNAMEVLRANR